MSEIAKWEKGISGGRYSLALVGLVYNKQGFMFNRNSLAFSWEAHVWWCMTWCSCFKKTRLQSLTGIPQIRTCTEGYLFKFEQVKPDWLFCGSTPAQAGLTPNHSGCPCGRQAGRQAIHPTVSACYSCRGLLPAFSGTREVYLWFLLKKKMENKQDQWKETILYLIYQ